MYHQTHHPSGRHRHNAVFDWRSLRPAEADTRMGEPVRPHVLHTRQLDHLYSQLEDLKTNMREKAASLANIIDVQRKKIENQGTIILDLDQKLRYNQQKTLEESEEDFVFRDFVKNCELTRTDPIKNPEDTKKTTIKTSGKNFRELYQKAQDNTMKDIEKKSDAEIEEYEDGDDDDDSFITIDEDDYYEDDSGGSDSTLENSQSTDSGFHTDSAGSSYGVNPLFSLQSNDGTEACQDDFVFFNQKKDDSEKTRAGRIPVSAGGTRAKQKLSSSGSFGSLKRSHRIVIINNETALVCNESCLI